MMRAFLAILGAQARVFLRDRADFFFTLAFPLVFVVLFGFIWGGRENPTKVGLVCPPQEELVLSALSSLPEISVELFPDWEKLSLVVAKRAVDFGLVWNGEKFVLILNRGRFQENPEFERLSREIVRTVELWGSGLSSPVEPVKVHVGKVSAASWYHYIVPGLMAMAILQAGIFAVAGRMASMRERGILRPILATPASGWPVLLGIGLIRMGLGFFSAGLNFALARVLFGVSFPVNPALLLFYAFVCALGGMGLGALVSFGVRRPGSAAAAGMILTQIMLFLSGVYIPFEFLPPGLQAVGRVLPAYYMAQGFRAALGVVEGGAEILWASLGFGLFGVIALFLFGQLFLRPEKG
jgi:ABC-2 type transport system permease protein